MDRHWSKARGIKGPSSEASGIKRSAVHRRGSSLANESFKKIKNLSLPQIYIRQSEFSELASVTDYSHNSIMRRTRHVVLPVKSWQYMGLMVVSLACLTLGLVSRDRGGRSESLAGPELQHTAPHEVDACPNLHPFGRVSPYDESAIEKMFNDRSNNTQTSINEDDKKIEKSIVHEQKSLAIETSGNRRSINKVERNSDRRIRSIETSRFRKDISNGLNSDRSSRSRSREFREKPNSISLQRGMIDESRRQRVNSRSYDRRSSEGRDDRDTRNLSTERRLAQRVLDDTNRANRRASILRRDFRSSNEQDERKYAGSSRILRSSNDRMDRRTEDRRSRQSRTDLDRFATNGWNSRSSRRISVERGETNQRERRERSAEDRSMNPGSNVARKRSEDRANDARLEIPPKNRRSAGERKQVERQREMVRAERSFASRSSQVRDASRSPIFRRSSRHGVDGSDVRSTRGRSDGRNSVERRKITALQRETVRVDFAGRSRDVHRSASRLSDDGDFRRLGARMEERRMNSRRVSDSPDRRERTNDGSERRSQGQGERSLADRSRNRRSSSERREKLSARSVSSRLEERRSSGSEIRGVARLADAPLKETRNTRGGGIPARGEGSTSRHFASRERQAVVARSERRRASALDSSRRSSQRVVDFVNSQRHERSTERRPARRIADVKREGRTASTVNDFSLATRNRAQGRRDLTAERSFPGVVTRTNERRERMLVRDSRSLETSKKVNEEHGKRVTGREDGVGDRTERKTRNDRRIRSTVDDNNQRIFEKRSFARSFSDLSNFENIETNSQTNKNDAYPHQILVLVICAMYGASLLKGKGGFYSFRDIVTSASRLVVW